MNDKTKGLYPVLFTFFVMGFCDVVGISTSYVKQDFNLSEGLSGLIPSAVFLWFFILSIPAAAIMNRLGRKHTVLFSNAITTIAMLVPLINYNLVPCLISFALLGIGNTILQVSLNPLMTNVVNGRALTGALTGGQVVKAISSFTGPFLVTMCLSIFGKWQMIFPIYAAITIMSTIWLSLIPVEKEDTADVSVSMSECFKLLSDKNILMLFFGIFFIVGTDVAMNTVSVKLLMERCGLALKDAGLAPSIYFFCRTLGALLGTFLLSRMDNLKYYGINTVCAALSVVGLFFVRDSAAIMILVGLAGFFCSSLFSVIFGCALNLRSDKANEVSGLMITGIVGGAVIPPVMGVMTDLIGNQNGALAVISVCVAYLLFCIIPLKHML